MFKLKIKLKYVPFVIIDCSYDKIISMHISAVKL